MKVLIIEDSERLLYSLGRGLTKAGYAVDLATDGKTGLAFAETYDYDAIVLDELCARLQALVRRRYRAKNPRLRVGPLEIDTAGRRVCREGESIPLTPSEYALLEFLAHRRGRVFSCDQLLEQLYRSDRDVSHNAVEVLVSSLRKKIRRGDEPSIVETRRGFGYLIGTEAEGMA